MTKTRFQFFYDPGRYDQTQVAPRKRLDDARVQDFCQQWLTGKNTVWLGLRFGLHPKAIRGHARRLEFQGILPAGTAEQPCRMDLIGVDPGPTQYDARGRVVGMPDPKCGFREIRRGRPKGSYKRLSGSGQQIGSPVTMAAEQTTHLPWWEIKRLREARERGEVAASMEGQTNDTTDDRAAGGEPREGTAAAQIGTAAHQGHTAEDPQPADQDQGRAEQSGIAERLGGGAGGTGAQALGKRRRRGKAKPSDDDGQ